MARKEEKASGFFGVSIRVRVQISFGTSMDTINKNLLGLQFMGPDTVVKFGCLKMEPVIMTRRLLQNITKYNTITSLGD
jgi:hypothetical protein